MSKLRYVKTADQIAKARQNNPEFLESSVRSLRYVYETDPAIAAARHACRPTAGATRAALARTVA